MPNDSYEMCKEKLTGRRSHPKRSCWFSRLGGWPGANNSTHNKLLQKTATETYMDSWSLPRARAEPFTSHQDRGGQLASGGSDAKTTTVTGIGYWNYRTKFEVGKIPKVTSTWRKRNEITEADVGSIDKVERICCCSSH